MARVDGAEPIDGAPPLTLLHRDAHLAAFHKPAGMLVHRSRVDAHAERFALQEARNVLGQHVYPVHRLDKPTSGVLLFALSPDDARTVGEAFAAHRVQKTYLAIVRGHAPVRGVVDKPLAPLRDRADDRRGRQEKPARPARTIYRRLATTTLPLPIGRFAEARYSLVALRPRTGRQHQLRRHLNRIAYPIVGDYRHGDYRHNRLLRDALGIDRLLLAATVLRLPHPATGEPLCIECPLETGFADALTAMGLR